LENKLLSKNKLLHDMLSKCLHTSKQHSTKGRHLIILKKNIRLVAKPARNPNIL